MKVVVHIEGGGDNKTQQAELRKAFAALFERAGLRGRMPSIDCSGSRNNACRDFLNGRGVSGRHALLLVDSEGSVASGSSAVSHLRRRDQWQLDAAHEPDVHLMVQLMESWFLADKSVLQSVFGSGFNATKLPGMATDIEPTPKRDVIDGIDAATRNSKRGKYRKGRDSHEVLSRLDTEKVAAASPHANRFFERLRVLTA